MSPRKVPVSEIAQHNRPEDIWIIVDGQVYDLTTFAPSHPGGSDIIYRYAGRDASNEYNQVHSPSLIRDTLEPQQFIGSVDEPTLENDSKTTSHATSHSLHPKPPLHQILNLHDFQDIAQQTLSRKSWAFIHGAANDNITRDANQELLRRIWLRPAVMRDVTAVTTATTLFGCQLSMPVYIAPTGAARMAGPEGELGLAQAAGATGVIQCIATPSSPHREILDATRRHAFFQLYVNKDREASAAMIRDVTGVRGKQIAAILVTADLPVVSKREADERIKTEGGPVLVGGATVASNGDRKGAGLARQASAMIDPGLCWDDLRWLRGITDLPIVVKGIQRAEDARMALRLGCDGIVVSNHGGREADTAPPAILTLLELQRNCPEVFRGMEVLVDGGFRRGSDVVKAICLGASAVGLGRPVLYALGYGQEGVEHALEIIRDEVKTTMRLCGMADLMRDAHPGYTNTRQIDHLVMQEEPRRRVDKL
ncbi:hypothetical protein FE257_008843 [Aspergillus nanangensis]|uniref:Uncharacterized protein n=1 Tax=Aspergillus nanangensis TaxID=2582783 RepID=A0AAD4CM42_ASPNN|nr:hypothetical protein FE257_008843 [Aspergillus nanangensis]